MDPTPRLWPSFQIPLSWIVLFSASGDLCRSTYSFGNNYLLNLIHPIRMATVMTLFLFAGMANLMTGLFRLIIRNFINLFSS